MVLLLCLEPPGWKKGRGQQSRGHGVYSSFNPCCSWGKVGAALMHNMVDLDNAQWMSSGCSKVDSYMGPTGDQSKRGSQPVATSTSWARPAAGICGTIALASMTVAVTDTSHSCSCRVNMQLQYHFCMRIGATQGTAFGGSCPACRRNVSQTLAVRQGQARHNKLGSNQIQRI